MTAITQTSKDCPQFVKPPPILTPRLVVEVWLIARAAGLVSRHEPSRRNNGGAAVMVAQKHRRVTKKLGGKLVGWAVAVKTLVALVVHVAKAPWVTKQRRATNPYVVGAPVLDPNLFLGRNELIDRAIATIKSGHVLLYGERRIGKTSILHHLKRRLGELADAEMEFYPIFIDLQGVSGERLFSTLVEDIYTELSPHLANLPWRDRVSRGADFTELVDDVRELVRVLANQTGKKVKLVFLIDEADELNEYGERINFQLKSLFSRSFADHLGVIAAGVEVGDQWTASDCIWKGFFTPIIVAPLGRKDAAELIEGPLRPILAIDPMVIDRIISLSGGKPFLIQRLCSALTNRAHKTHQRVILPTDLDALLTESCGDSLCAALGPNREN